MILEILIGFLFLYCISLNVQLRRLKYSAQYGSPKCEKNIVSLWKLAEEQKEKTGAHSSRLWVLEHKAGMHPPQN